MLEFLTGADPLAKREYIGRCLNDTVGRGDTAVLIVPEQENFDRDRELMLRYGERVSNAVQITSFSRFSQSFLEARALAVKPRADENATDVLMSLAVRQVSDELEIYGRHYRRPGRIRELTAFYTEISNAGFSPEELKRAGQNTDGSLKRKTEELSLIFTAFEGLLTKRFSTETDNLNVAAAQFPLTDEFKNTDFWFDDFRGFTGAQIRFISALLPCCRNVYISLTGGAEGGETVWFPHVQKNRSRLIEAANKANVGIRAKEIPVLEKSPGLSHLRANLFADRPEKSEGAPEDIRIVRAANRYEECEYIALEARRLLDEGFCRARDMAVLHREEGLNAPLLAALKRYGVPVFEDERRPLYSYPLTRLILAATELAAKGFSTETALAALKTELTGIPLEEIAELQNYVYRWQIDGARWERDFTGDPRGFGETPDEAALETLAHINDVRRRFVAPIVKLRRALNLSVAETSCRAVFLYLKEIDAAAAFQRYAEYLFSRGEEARAIECAGVWDACMEHLNALCGAIGENSVSAVSFYELLTLILSQGTVGSIPPGVDKMTVGNIDRTRILTPKVVFIPGFAEGAFPRGTVSAGVLSAKELRRLHAEAFPLEKLPEEVYEEERLVLYNALNLPEKRLYLTYPAAKTTGEKTEPSPVLDTLKRIFPALKTSDAAPDRQEKVRTLETAFSALAAAAGENSPFTASLAALLREYPVWAGRINALSRAVNGADLPFNSPTEALRLFGRDLEMSASKVEAYAKCPFAYFCRYGLGVEKIEAAALDQRIYGNIIHKALEEIYNAHLAEGFGDLTDEQLMDEASLSVDRFVQNALGGAAELPPHLLRALERLKKEIFDILCLRRDEINTCLFQTVATEFSIGRSGGIDAYEVPLPGGGRLIIRGSVDRVDTMNTKETSYVRVIDYKTGGKEFVLSDVFFGLNMQMLIYLFAIGENGAPVFGETTPAGILYVPAKNAGETLERGADAQEIAAQRLKNGRMNGVILEDPEVVRGMETAARGLFINAEITADGKLVGKFLTLPEFRLLHGTVNRVLQQTGTAIRNGEIAAVPLGTDRAPCRYCSYKAVCLKEENSPVRRLEKLKHGEAVQKLYEEAGL